MVDIKFIICRLDNKDASNNEMITVVRVFVRSYSLPH